MSHLPLGPAPEPKQGPVAEYRQVQRFFQSVCPFFLSQPAPHFVPEFLVCRCDDDVCHMLHLWLLVLHGSEGIPDRLYTRVKIEGIAVICDEPVVQRFFHFPVFFSDRRYTLSCHYPNNIDPVETATIQLVARGPMLHDTNTRMIQVLS